MANKRGNLFRRAFNEKLNFKNMLKGIIILLSFIFTNIFISLKFYKYKNLRFFYYKLYSLTKLYADSDKFELIRKDIKDDFVYLDIGAALGLYIDFVATEMKKFTGGIIYAIEPDPISLYFLSDVIEKHKNLNIKVFKCAAWDKDDVIKFYVCNQNLGENSASKSDVHGGEIVVSGNRIDSLIDNNTKINLIKMDIQGAEFRALKGMNILLENMASGAKIIFECSPDDLLLFDNSPEEILLFLNNMYFQIYNMAQVEVKNNYFNNHEQYSYNQEDLLCIKIK